MRVDRVILEDVTQITDSLSSATVAVDKVAQVPATAVENLTTRLRDAFKPRRASEVSRALGGQKEAVEEQAAADAAAEAAEAADAAAQAAADAVRD